MDFKQKEDMKEILSQLSPEQLAEYQSLLDKATGQDEYATSKAALAEERKTAKDTRKFDPAIDHRGETYARADAPTVRINNVRDLLACKDTKAAASAVGVSPAFVEDFAEWQDDLYIRSRFCHVDGRPAPVQDFPQYSRFWNSSSVQSELKSLYSTGAGVGDEWVPTSFSRQWIEKVGSQGEVFPLFTHLEMTGNPQVFPVFAGRSASLYLQGESVTDTPVQFRHTDVTTAQLSLNAKQLALHVKYSEEFAEDAVAGSIDRLKMDLANTAAYGIDYVIIHGDASANGFDTGVSPESDDKLKAFDGLRYYVNVTDTTARVDCSGVTYSSPVKIADVMAAMGNYLYPNVGKPVILLSRILGTRLGLMTDGNDSLIASTGGAEAAALGRPVDTLLDAKVVRSEAMLTTLNASGVYDDSDTAYSNILVFNPDAFVVGIRRGWTLELEKNIKTGVYDLVMTCRCALASPYTADGGEVVGECYGVLTSW